MSIEMPVGDDAIRENTGKGWQEWKSLLDDWNAAAKSHTDIARYVNEECGVDGWWSQSVTVGYERMIGRRAVGQRNDGTFSASVSKTIPANIAEVHAALVDESLRVQWLDDAVVTLRTAVAPKSARFDDLESGIIIAFFLDARGDDKCAVQCQADGHPGTEAADAWKAAWRPRLNSLAVHFARD